MNRDWMKVIELRFMLCWYSKTPLNSGGKDERKKGMKNEWKEEGKKERKEEGKEERKKGRTTEINK